MCKKRYKFTAEHKRKMKENHKGMLGHKHSEETKQKMSETHIRIGNKPPSWLGKKHTKETRKKMSEIQKLISDNPKKIKQLIERNKQPWSEERRRKQGENKKRYWNSLTEEKKKELIKKTSIKNIGKKRTDEQRMNISLSLRGEKSSFYIDGRTSKNQKIRASSQFAEWRNKVFERDNWTCQKTKIKGNYLEAHHIQNFSEYIELRFTVENGITLSEEEHQKFHNKYGFKNNTKEQLIEFLNYDQTRTKDDYEINSLAKI